MKQALGLLTILIAASSACLPDTESQRAKPAYARAMIQASMTALATYKLDVGSYPTAAEGLHALFESPANVPGWKGPYLKADASKDPWGHDYIYKYPGDHGDQPDVSSLGADGKPGGEGPNADIVSWN